MMNFRRPFAVMMIAALMAFMAIGTSSAALACAAPEAASGPCGAPGCGPDAIAHDCAMSCAPACAAVLPNLVGKTDAPDRLVSIYTAPARPMLILHSVGPEPPPPRSA